MARVTAYAPASMGNVSVGFDLLGAALQPVDGTLLGDRVSVEEAALPAFRCCGPYQDVLPKDPAQNIVLRAVDAFFKASGLASQPLALTLEKNLPVGSGLGSSASSVVAACAALNRFFGEPLSQVALLKLMGELEGEISGSVHYDNVAPSYLGGLQLMVADFARKLPAFDDWYWVVAYSGISLSTAKMRALLPAHYDRGTTIAFGQNLAAFVDACYRQDQAQALAMLKDELAEPYRAPHIPGFVAAKAALTELGAEAVGISGSGPTLFSVCRDIETARQAKAYLDNCYLANARGFAHICRLAEDGVIYQSEK
ncbi:homoserine kinase [Ferrimonas sediminicola]|uniref:Homoserine kinase n=1 Tax=Ferrimonas sediminicola TaxID=2569538 RepID=A0A4U1BE77_9GAMM|nr:homoserine kinase [Ferrimonas sediminicola]TKB49336.1 homoserine kinase [Ferrimonas sediminicola]